MRPSPTESVEATENAPLSAAAEPRSPIRSGIATRRRRAESGSSSTRKAMSRKSPSKRAEAFSDSGSRRFCARPSAVKSRCPGDDMSRPIRPMSARVPAAVSFIRTVRSFNAGGIAAGQRSAISRVFRSAESAAESGVRGSVRRMPGPAETSARSRERAVPSSNPESETPAGPISNRPLASRTESPLRSVNVSCRSCRAMSAPRL